MSGVPPKHSIIYVPYAVKGPIKRNTTYSSSRNKQQIITYLGLVVDDNGLTYFDVDNDLRTVNPGEKWDHANVPDGRKTLLKINAYKNVGYSSEEISAAYTLSLLKNPNAMGKTRRKRKPTKRKPRKSKPKKRTKRRRNKQTGGT